MADSKALPDKNKLVTEIGKLFDNETVNRIAAETGFVQRQSKLTGIDFFFLCVFAHQKSDSISLEGLCADLLKEGVSITKQSLQERFNDQSSCFMEKMAARIMSEKLDLPSIIEHPVFSRIIIGDSTVFQLPAIFAHKYRGCGGGASNAGLKIQYAYDLLSQAIFVMLVDEGVEPDSNMSLGDVKKGDLRIEDLGYFKLTRFKSIEEAEGFYLSRLKFGINVYVIKEGNYQEIDILEIQQSLYPGKQLVLEVYLGKKEKLPARLIIEKVPSDIANEKRRKLKTDKQNKRKNLSKDRLQFCDINAFITNTTEEQIPAKDIRLYYSLRWQIEIVFKAWKTVYRIDQIKQMKIQRFESIHYGALILILLTTRLLAFCKATLYIKHHQEISELKFFKTLKLAIIELRYSLLNPAELFSDFLSLLLLQVEKTCNKEQKRTRITPFLIIQPNP